MRKSYRVKKEQDFQTVFDASQSVANRNFVVYRLDKPGQNILELVFLLVKK